MKDGKEAGWKEGKLTWGLGGKNARMHGGMEAGGKGGREGQNQLIGLFVSSKHTITVDSGGGRRKVCRMEGKQGGRGAY